MKRTILDTVARLCVMVPTVSAFTGIAWGLIDAASQMTEPYYWLLAFGFSGLVAAAVFGFCYFIWTAET